MTIGVKQTIHFQTVALYSEIQTPMALVTMKIENGEGVMQMGGSEMPMQPAQLNEALGELYRHPVYLTLNHETRIAEYMGMEEIEGKEYAHIRMEEKIVLNISLADETAMQEVTT